MLDQIFVFDIETIPDTDAVPNLTGLDNKDIDMRRKSLEDYHLNITDGRNAFPRQCFHKVVAISFLRARILRDGDYETYQIEEIRSGGNEHSDEEELIRGFFQYCGKHVPRLISFNGRGFDLPVLKYRAMKYGISAEWLHKVGDKWNNYNQRYSKAWHCDLLEQLSDYGASARLRLNEVCAAFNLPGKTGVDGGDVMELYDQGKIQEIRDYCETDVINTFLVYLRYALHTGVTDADGYNHARILLQSELEERSDKNMAYKEFLEAWRKSSQGNFSAL
ncbi:3'-5' exonuclease [Curvivirga aplysinae]|uniref:3'-5' exonuclease n=1 Tax=Curvivirga aplysinae TaxID=2529852 RepID=UPI0012BB997D|nr:3'-5' exonuclease [Curvivirga aplysinae]MTI10608.1 3'-5' exonuclease [Curvivirga aplysinae]